jgi:hypothetical protein
MDQARPPSFRVMDSWEKLFSDLTETQRARAQAARDGEKVMAELAENARDRAGEIRERTGRQVEVEYPSSGPVGKGPDGPDRTFLRLRTERSRELHLYFHRGDDGACAIHLFRGQVLDGNGRKRVASKVICVVPPGARELRDHTGSVVTIDDVVLRGFRMLLLV